MKQRKLQHTPKLWRVIRNNDIQATKVQYMKVQRLKILQQQIKAYNNMKQPMNKLLQ